MYIYAYEKDEMDPSYVAGPEAATERSLGIPVPRVTSTYYACNIGEQEPVPLGDTRTMLSSVQPSRDLNFLSRKLEDMLGSKIKLKGSQVESTITGFVNGVPPRKDIFERPRRPLTEKELGAIKDTVRNCIRTVGIST